MRLGPRDLDKLILHNAGFLAQKRLARGLRLNYPEAVALIATQLLELVRDGRSVAELMDIGRTFLGLREVMDGVPELVSEVQVEGTFPDGTKLVTVHRPIVAEHGDLQLALYGSFLPVPDRALFAAPPSSFIPGEITVGPDDIVLNAGRAVASLDVTNTGDRPIQVGSHCHFVETNRALVFDRDAVVGMRLDIPAGAAVRFEPGETKRVDLVAARRRRDPGGPPSRAQGGAETAPEGEDAR